jgi:hypothetical protein
VKIARLDAKNITQEESDLDAAITTKSWSEDNAANSTIPISPKKTARYRTSVSGLRSFVRVIKGSEQGVSTHYRELTKVVKQGKH